MKQKILILGASGMIGHKLLDQLSRHPHLDVYATVRSSDKLHNLLRPALHEKIISNIDANNDETIKNLLTEEKPNVVINCIGITKQLTEEDNPLETIEINSAFPHRLAAHCSLVNTRMVQFATDCVFNGSRGLYKETDPSDATDLYGRSKCLGEVNYPNTLTIRTSFIGHELKTKYGLIEWFLSQDDRIRGYTEAIYSGIPTVIISSILAKHVLPNSKLHGLYHLSADPISKYDLLNIVARVYNKKIQITPNDTVNIDRSLDSSKFRSVVGFKPVGWDKMVEIMHRDYLEYGYENFRD